MIQNLIVRILNLVLDLNLILYSFFGINFEFFTFSSVLPEISKQDERGP